MADMPLDPSVFYQFPMGGAAIPCLVLNGSPSNTKNQFPAPYLWLDPLTENLWFQGDTVGTNWVLIASGSGDIVSVLGTTNQITSTVSGGVATLSIPTTFIAPGSIASTTTLTGGTGITATAGNLTLSAAGSKLVIHATTSASDSVGTTAAMTTGAVTITSSAITTSSKIIYSRATTGGTAGQVAISAQSAGSATLTSSSSTETSTFNYLIIN